MSQPKEVHVHHHYAPKPKAKAQPRRRRERVNQRKKVISVALNIIEEVVRLL